MDKIIDNIDNDWIELEIDECNRYFDPYTGLWIINNGYLWLYDSEGTFINE